MFLSIPFRSLLTVVLLIFFSKSVAQKTRNDQTPVVKLGHVDLGELAHKPADTTEAIVLYDYGEVSFEEAQGDIWLQFTHHVRTKINKKSAYDRATIQIPVRRTTGGHYEYVVEFTGYSYNQVDGNLVREQMAKSGHFTERMSDTYAMEKYTLPDVREGSIIEYQYILRSPFSVAYNPRTWRFQQTVPVNWSEYRITIPDYFYYKIFQTGYVPMFINERSSTRFALFSSQQEATASVYRFVSKDVPAFRNEPYVTTEDDYLSKIEFELASYRWRDLINHDMSVSWETLDRTLLNDGDFGGAIKRAGFLRETAKTLASQSADTLAQVTAAYEFIRKNVKWNQTGGIYSLEDTKKVFENKKGSAGSINLMLVALLREMKLDANPVILSTRDHGHINESYPLLKRFNYTVAQVLVNGKDLLLDATDDLLTPGMLPVHCLNGSGRLISSERSRFISLTPPERYANAFTGVFAISDDGELTGTIRHSHGGYSALDARRKLSASGQTSYLTSMQQHRPNWQIEKADLSGSDWASSTFNIDYTLTIPEACGRAGDRLYLRPMLTEGRGMNPFKEANRIYPVDFGYPQDETFMATYTLPAGYQVEEMPKPVSMTLPENMGRFVYQVAINAENKLQIVSRIHLRKSVYYADEYPNVRELFSRIIAKHAEPVVLKRGTVAEKK